MSAWTILRIVTAGVGLMLLALGLALVGLHGPSDRATGALVVGGVLAPLSVPREHWVRATVGVPFFAGLSGLSFIAKRVLSASGFEDAGSIAQFYWPKAALFALLMLPLWVFVRRERRARKRR